MSELEKAGSPAFDGEGFYRKVEDILVEARCRAVSAVNLSMVYAYFEIGRMIVEEQQKGKSRAEYGKQILQGLSAYLTERFGRGFSLTNLGQMRKFYRVYSQDPIPQTLSEEFGLS